MAEFYTAASGDLSQLVAGLFWKLQCSRGSLHLLSLMAQNWVLAELECPIKQIKNSDITPSLDVILFGTSQFFV